MLHVRLSGCSWRCQPCSNCCGWCDSPPPTSGLIRILRFMLSYVMVGLQPSAVLGIEIFWEELLDGFIDIFLLNVFVQTLLGEIKLAWNVIL